ncbi:MAG: hypothetical protein JWM12_1926 [Ilumatobacteraceae bacterium]|nr:hypothetical protein [Ilumatobacteraceae bacterium]
MVGGLARVLAAALLGAAMLAAGPIVARAAPVKPEALLVGDSVLNGLAQGYGSAGRVALAARHSYILDSAGCRRLITTSCRIPPGPTPTNAITVVRGRAGQYDRALVIAAGYDDPTSGPFGIGAAVSTIVAEARNQSIGHVIWLTYREAGSSGNMARFRSSNAVLRSLQGTYPELLLADWAARSAALPTGWFSSDGIHLGPQAAAAMADLIGDALDEVLTEPARCTSGVWSGSVVPDAAPSAGGAATGGLRLMPMPVRFLDTRDLPGKLGAGQVLAVVIAGVNGVPADATAAIVSVTAVEPCADTFLTVFPCGGAPPTASTVNALARSIVANAAIVRLGGGALCVGSLRPTDVIVDVSGWIAPGGLGSTPVAPVRLVDTRPGEPQALAVAQHRVGAGRLLTVAVASLTGFDASAAAATVNVTAADPAGSGFLTVLPGPCAGVQLPPSTSNLNVTAHRDVAASATVGLGGGELCVYASVDTDVVVDLQATHGVGGGMISAVDPLRIVDTRTTGRIAAGRSLPVGVGVTAAAAIVNVTAVDPSASGFLTLYPCGTAVPTASNVNFVAGAVVANRAVVSTGGTDHFCLFSSADTDVVIDLSGTGG